uniref:Uncharacterized protein n=1 Tax=Chlamydomonas euryale TaxID=1486919 RepID=A0A7R9YQA5_9CHLO
MEPLDVEALAPAAAAGAAALGSASLRVLSLAAAAEVEAEEAIGGGGGDGLETAVVDGRAADEAFERYQSGELSLAAAIELSMAAGAVSGGGGSAAGSADVLTDSLLLALEQDMSGAGEGGDDGGSALGSWFEGALGASPGASEAWERRLLADLAAATAGDEGSGNGERGVPVWGVDLGVEGLSEAFALSDLAEGGGDVEAARPADGGVGDGEALARLLEELRGVDEEAPTAGAA